jgi:hypothetical protein
VRRRRQLHSDTSAFSRFRTRATQGGGGTPDYDAIVTEDGREVETESGARVLTESQS